MHAAQSIRTVHLVESPIVIVIISLVIVSHFASPPSSVIRIHLPQTACSVLCIWPLLPAAAESAKPVYYSHVGRAPQVETVSSNQGRS